MFECDFGKEKVVRKGLPEERRVLRSRYAYKIGRIKGFAEQVSGEETLAV